MTKKILTLLVVAIVCLSAVALASQFTDVKDSHWAAKSIERWAKEDIIVGYPDGTYKPENHITRAEYATLLVKIFEPKSEADVTKYKDVKEKEWYSEAISKVLAAGMIEETSSNTLAPNDYVTRQEFIVTINSCIKVAAKNKDEAINKFTDREEIDDYAVADMEAFTETGRIVGYPDGSCGPQELITRAEAAAVLDRLIYAIVDEGGEVDCKGTDDVIIVKSKDVTLTNADDAVLVFLNDEVLESTKGVTKAAKKDSVVINPTSSESKTTGRTSYGGSSSSSSSSAKTAVLTVVLNESQNGNYYTCTGNGVEVAEGNKLTVTVNGKKVVTGKKITDSKAFIESVTKVGKEMVKLDAQAVINTVDADYGDDADVEKWAIATIGEVITDGARYAQLATVARDNEGHRIKAVYEALTDSEKSAVASKAFEILEAAYNNTYEDEAANSLVTFEYVVGKLAEF